MKRLDEIMKQLQEKSRPGQLTGMKRYGMNVDKRLGVAVPEMRAIAKKTAKDHHLALALWKTGIPDAMITASMVDIPADVTEEQMEDWVKDFNSWDVCDQVCMNLFDKTPFAWKKVVDWSKREEEFVKRAAFALIACLAWHDKGAPDEKFIELLPVIIAQVTDERNFVKKAVNWALRHIGKRNINLNRIVLQAAQDILTIESKTAKWIAADAIKDLTSETTLRRLNKTKNKRNN
jgi:3-methyladenine DNA glycosylase AlkD